jgi:hypothetical protein
MSNTKKPVEPVIVQLSRDSAYKGRQSIEFTAIQQKQGDLQMNNAAKSESKDSVIDSWKRFFSFGTKANTVVPAESDKNPFMSPDMS